MATSITEQYYEKDFPVITFEDKEWEVVKVTQEIEYHYGALNYQSINLEIRPVKPKPKPGDFKHGDFIVSTFGDKTTAERWRALYVDGAWWRRKGNIMFIIGDVHHWVRVE